MWTVGKHNPTVVNDSNGHPVCQCQLPTHAAKIVAAVNAMESDEESIGKALAEHSRGETVDLPELTALDRAEILRVLEPLAKHWARAGYPDSALRDRYTECWSTMSATDIKAAADLHAKMSGEPKETK